jgi:hypothetical protein
MAGEIGGGHACGQHGFGSHDRSIGKATWSVASAVMVTPSAADTCRGKRGSISPRGPAQVRAGHGCDRSARFSAPAIATMSRQAVTEPERGRAGEAAPPRGRRTDRLGDLRKAMVE